LFIREFKGLLKEKYNKDISNFNNKSLINIIRHQGISNLLFKEIEVNNIGEGLYCILNEIKEKPKCFCGKELKYINFSKGYREFCSLKCKTKGVRNRTVQTCLKKYGTTTPLSNKKIRQKSINTWMKKYGVNNPSKSKEIIQKLQKKSKNTLKKEFYNSLFDERLNKKIKPLFKFEEYEDVKKEYFWECLQCNNKFYSNIISGKIPRCPKCFPRDSSFLEKEIINFIISIIGTEKIKINDRSFIYPYELDTVIPSKKIAIEFNGLYSHSELSGKDRNYHLNKTEKCKEKGYQLIQIFEDEWLDKQEIVKSILKAKLDLFDRRIYARKCIIKEVSNKKSRDFLEKNHIQGPINSSINYGLYYEEELISLVCFSKSRFSKNYDYELLRFCTSLNIQVIGGFSKLLKYFQKVKPEANLISYCDIRYSNGQGYLNSGWKLLYQSKPNYWYFNQNRILESRMKYQKHKIPNVNLSLTEWENMQLNGYDRIWDCGNLVFCFYK